MKQKIGLILLLVIFAINLYYVNIVNAISKLDDFSTSQLDPIWIFTDPRANSQYSLTANPGHLQVSVPTGSEHDCWTDLTNCARMLRNANNADGIYETKIDGQSISTNAQTYGIMLWQDALNYIRFEYWTDGRNPIVAAWKIINGQGSNAIFGPSITLGSANYLRVTKTGNTFKLEYSQNGINWNTAGSFTQTFTVNQAGLVVINAVTNPRTTGNFDYFSVSQSADTIPSIRSNGQPTGSLSTGTTQTSISLTTNEAATCKYSTSSNVVYSSMINAFVTTGGINHSTTVTGLTDGNIFNYYVRCQDAAGNTNFDDYFISFSVASPPPLDTTPPTVSVISPPNSQTVSSMITISATASDNVGVAGVQFKADDVNIGAEDTTTPYSTTLKTTTLTNGTHNLTATARDIAGNTASNSIIVMVSNIIDTTAPVLSNLRATSITADSATIMWSTDEPATSTVEYGTTSGYGLSSENPVLTTSHSVVLTNLVQQMQYHFHVNSTDNLGNSIVSDDNTFTTNQLTQFINGSLNVTGIVSADTIQTSVLQLISGGVLLLPNNIILSAMITNLDASKIIAGAFGPGLFIFQNILKVVEDLEVRKGLNVSGGDLYVDDATGMIGIGTANPISQLQIEGLPGYLHININSTAMPITDCDEAAEAGRIVLDSSGDKMWVCSGTGGWKSLPLS